jgi:sugar phosphate isomerase/epimerase
MNTNVNITRRAFVRSTLLAASTASLVGCATSGGSSAKKPLFGISLAEWSLHRTIRNEKKLTNLDFPVVARRDFGIDAIEYVNQFFMDKAKDTAYLRDLKERCEDQGVRSLLIMCDREGNLGDADSAKRTRAVENHYKWAEAAKLLGGHSIRVNAATGNVGDYNEQMDRAADGLRRLSEFCGTLGLNCIVENHGGLSSNGAWLAGVMRKVNLPNCGTLPDFGNFDLGGGEAYDRYKGVTEMMPFAKAVSAKAHDFDEQGNCVETDYRRMIRIVLDAGYHGYLGIEYEGSKLSEYDGILATKRLLERVKEEFSSAG